MNEERINSTICQIPLRRSKVKNILQNLRTIQRDVIRTIENFYDYDLLFKIEFKLNALLKQRTKKVHLNYKLSTVKTISILLDEVLLNLSKEHKNMSDYKALFKFNERLNKSYISTEDKAIELEASFDS